MRCSSNTLSMSWARRLRVSFQQHERSTTATGTGRRITVGQYLPALCQPVASQPAQYGFTSRAIHSFSVDYQHTAQPSLCRNMKELLQQFARHIAGVSVQVKNIPNGPLAAPKLAQGHTRQAVADKFVRRGFEGEIGKRIGYRRRRFGGAHQGPAACSLRFDAVLPGQRLHFTDCGAEQRRIFWLAWIFRLGGVLFHRADQVAASEARYLSASSAAMQPVAALVQAWR